jgi:hypothetical protein
MILMSVNHKVSDYEVWKKLFDGDESRRRSFGIRTIKLMRNIEDSNELHFLMEAPSKQSFLDMMNDPSVSDMGNRAGVIGTPIVSFLEEIS